MSHGIITYNPNGKVNLNSLDNSPCLIGSFITVADAGGSYSYPAYAGATIEIFAYGYNWFASSTAFSVPTEFSIDYTLGYPRVSWLANPYSLSSVRALPMVVNVYLKTQAAAGDPFGLQITNDNNEVITFREGDNLHFVGKATFVGELSRGYAPSNLAYRRSYSITTTDGFPIVFIQNIEGQLATLFSVALSGNTYTFMVLTDTAAVPALYCFCRKTGNTTVGQYGVALYNAAGKLLLDPSATTLNAPGYSVIITPAVTYGNTTWDNQAQWAYTAPSTSYLGTVGSMPTNSATLMTAVQGFVGEFAGRYQTWWPKAFSLGVKRSFSSLYTGWLASNSIAALSYNTIFPLYYNLNKDNRLYIIDTSVYD